MQSTPTFFELDELKELKTKIKKIQDEFIKNEDFFFNMKKKINKHSIFKENIIQFHYIPKVETNLVSLEDKIKLIKMESIKEKAYVKYNELLLKNDESYTKTKTYLDGLLKIPFGIYKKEPILNIMNDIKNDMNFFEEKTRSNLQIYNELSILLTLPYFEYDEKLLFHYLNGLLKNELLPLTQIDFTVSDIRDKINKFTNINSILITGGSIADTLFLMFFNKYVCILVILLLVLLYFYIK
jgi:hypothetical protein